MVSKSDNLRVALEKNPEIGLVLSNSGLHCVGCHSSVAETIEDGCKVHGMTDKQINDLIKKANDRIKLFDSLPDLEITAKAISKLEEKLKKANGKYIRIIPFFDGYDFDVVNGKEKNEIVLDRKVKILLNKGIQRVLKGITIDYSDKEKDFVAKRKD